MHSPLNECRETICKIHTTNAPSCTLERLLLPPCNECHSSFLASANLANLRAEAPMILSTTAIAVTADVTYSLAWAPRHGKGPVSMSVTHKVITLSAVTAEKSMWKNPHWMTGIKPRSLAQKFSALSLDHHLHTSWQNNVFLYYSIYLWKALMSSYQKNVVNAAFPPYAERIFKTRKCDALCFWKFKS